ncbi:protein kinase domain-containing protein [Cryptosporidium andersoni]|uniref:Protein kinase domain-containing protein n=1 Tax=Cryptosporidium andersoni TaxID=117008 RepID=A0A1J4MT59_9CRYT|nr:protein kinase domain-containing protein [Cryptosporidium andersoni]
MGSLAEEILAISRYKGCVIHIIDYGFLLAENPQLTIWSSSYSSKSLVSFVESTRNSGDNNYSPAILTIMICSEQKSNLDKFELSKVSKYFCRIEFELVITKQYPAEGPEISFLAFHNMCKAERYVIKDIVHKYISSNKGNFVLNGIVDTLLNYLNRQTPLSIKPTKNYFEDVHLEDMYLPSLFESRQVVAEYQPLSESFHEVTITSQLGNTNSRLDNDFEVLEILGFGGFGSVFRVREKAGGRCIYAIKRIPLKAASTRENQVLINEAAMLACLNHDKIVRYYQAWTEGPQEISFNLDQGDITSLNKVHQTSNYENKMNLSFLKSISSISEINLQRLSNKSTDKHCNVNSDLEISLNSKECRGREYTIKQSMIYLYIQMEYCPGDTLQTAINKGLLYKDHYLIWHLFYQIIEGLSYLHGKGVIHRDLKPSNIFLKLERDTLEGHTDISLPKSNKSVESRAIDIVNNVDKADHLDHQCFLVKLGDFGLTTFVHTGSSTDKHDATNFKIHGDSSSFKGYLSSGVGTMFYMAPEQANGNVYDQSADLFSMGVILFEMFYPPFQTEMERVAVLSSLTQRREFPYNHKIPSRTVSLIRALLSPIPSHRPTAYQLLYNEWILEQSGRSVKTDLLIGYNYAKFSEDSDRDKAISAVVKTNGFLNSRENIASKICSIIRRNPYSTESIQVISTLFSLGKRLAAKTASFGGMVDSVYNDQFAYVQYNSFPYVSTLWKLRSKLIQWVSTSFKHRGAVEVEVPLLRPNIPEPSFSFLTSEFSSFVNNWKSDIRDSLNTHPEVNKPNQSKTTLLRTEVCKASSDLNNSHTANFEENMNSQAPLILDNCGIPLILCSQLLPNMAILLGDGRGLKSGAVVKRWCISSNIFLECNGISIDSNENTRSLFTNNRTISNDKCLNFNGESYDHPKNTLAAAYDIVVKIDDAIEAEFLEQIQDQVQEKEFIGYSKILKSKYLSIGHNTIAPLSYYNIVMYYDLELILTAIDTLRPFEPWIGKQKCIWGDSQLFTVLMEDWVGLTSNKASYFQAWLQDIIPKGLSKQKFYDTLWHFGKISLAESAAAHSESSTRNCFTCSDSTESTLPSPYFIGLTILLHPTVLEVVAEWLWQITFEFEGSIREFVDLVYYGSKAISESFYTQKKKYMATAIDESHRKTVSKVTFPSSWNLLNQADTSVLVNEADEKTTHFPYNNWSAYITPNLSTILYRILYFDEAVAKTFGSSITCSIYFDPLLISGSTFFNSGFFFYIYTVLSTYGESDTLPYARIYRQDSDQTKRIGSFCKAGSTVEYAVGYSSNINSSFTAQQVNLGELLVKGGRYDDWYIRANRHSNIFKFSANYQKVDKISAVGFEIFLGRILQKLFLFHEKDFKYLMNFDRARSQVEQADFLYINQNNPLVYIIARDIRFQVSALKLKQLLSNKGIRCQRRIIGNFDGWKSRNWPKLLNVNTHWIVLIYRGNIGDSRKLLNLGNSNFNTSYIDAKYKIEFCGGNIEVNQTNVIRSFIKNWSSSHYLSSLDITLDNENEVLDFFTSYYNIISH